LKEGGANDVEVAKRGSFTANIQKSTVGPDGIAVEGKKKRQSAIANNIIDITAYEDSDDEDAEAVSAKKATAAQFKNVASQFKNLVWRPKIDPFYPYEPKVGLKFNPDNLEKYSAVHEANKGTFAIFVNFKETSKNDEKNDEKGEKGKKKDEKDDEVVDKTALNKTKATLSYELGIFNKYNACIGVLHKSTCTQTEGRIDGKLSYFVVDFGALYDECREARKEYYVKFLKPKLKGGKGDENKVEEEVQDEEEIVDSTEIDQDDEDFDLKTNEFLNRKALKGNPSLKIVFISEEDVADNFDFEEDYAMSDEESFDSNAVDSENSLDVCFFLLFLIFFSTE
jgi:hypothetical protein